MPIYDRSGHIPYILASALPLLCVVIRTPDWRVFDFRDFSECGTHDSASNAEVGFSPSVRPIAHDGPSTMAP